MNDVLILKMESAVVLHEHNDAVVWCSEETALLLSGFGENVYTVKALHDDRGKPIWLVECPVWHDEHGQFRLAVNHCTVEQAVIAADRAVRFLGDVL